MKQPTRRHFLGSLGAAACAAAIPRAAWADAADADDSLSLGFSLYGTKSLSTEDALRAVAEIGFDSTELCLLPEWDSAPGRLDHARRKAIRSLLDGEGLLLPALMENVSLSGTSASQQPVLERLKHAAQLARDLNPDSPPLIETTAGGGRWSDLRDELRDNLGGWAKVAESTQTVICVKPHRGGVIDRPEYGVWLVEQIDSPWIQLNYDYSHFSHRDIPLEESIRVMMPHTRYIHVKDTVMDNGKARFVLPGESGAVRLREAVEAGLCGRLPRRHLLRGERHGLEPAGLRSDRRSGDMLPESPHDFQLAGIRRPGSKG